MWLSQDSTRPSIASSERRPPSSAILEAIRELGPSTTKEIALHTGQPLRQASAAVRHLRVQGLVELDPASIKRRFILTVVGLKRIDDVNRSSD